MALHKIQKYLFKFNLNSYYFYLSNNLLYSEINRNEKKIKSIISNNILNFSVYIDDFETCHIICVDFSGNLIYFSNKYNLWNKKVITSLNINLYDFTNLKIYVVKEDIHILLLKTEKSNSDNKYSSIIYYSIRNLSWKNYEIAKIVTDKYRPSFKSDIDNYGNIHLIYKSVNKKINQIFYRMFNNKYKKWNMIEKLSGEYNNVINFNILCDTYNTVHIVYSHIFKKNIRIVYLKKEMQMKLTSKWTNIEKFPFENIAATHLILVQDDNFIKAIWKQNNIFYFAQYNIMNNIWQDIEKININIDRNKLISITFFEKNSDNFRIIKAPIAYGYDINKPFIIGIDESNKFKNNDIFKEKFIDINTINDLENDNMLKFSISNYFKTINEYFENSSITKHLFFRKEEEIENETNELQKIKNISMLDIADKFIYIYRELEALKNRELLILNSLFEIKNNYSEIYEKFEEALKIYKNIDKQDDKLKPKKTFNKIINMFNDYNYTSLKQKNRK
ncbi:hypothetical protein [Caminicella sporogenes]|uniref:hypothetical protein n=1 Tax=Caminicella sporogenes TaxID=166485 RepID=UPI00253FB4A8|nr:hypothetical protein [Caminicella sporogenes]WIF94835.1 hypothetical protein QNI18_11320 [Caminicella sporogenes]